MERTKVTKGEFLDLPVVTFRGEKYFISEVPNLEIASQGKTVEESVKNLREAVELYFDGEDVNKLLRESGFKPSTTISLEIARFSIKKVVNGRIKAIVSP